MEMLDELLERGAKVLMFSQFTSMLALIEAGCTRPAIRYVLADRRHRATASTRSRSFRRARCRCS